MIVLSSKCLIEFSRHSSGLDKIFYHSLDFRCLRSPCSLYFFRVQCWKAVLFKKLVLFFQVVHSINIVIHSSLLRAPFTSMLSIIRFLLYFWFVDLSLLLFPIPGIILSQFCFSFISRNCLVLLILHCLFLLMFVYFDLYDFLHFSRRLFFSFLADSDARSVSLLTFSHFL